MRHHCDVVETKVMTRNQTKGIDMEGRGGQDLVLVLDRRMVAHLPEFATKSRMRGGKAVGVVVPPTRLLR